MKPLCRIWLFWAVTAVSSRKIFIFNSVTNCSLPFEGKLIPCLFLCHTQYLLNFVRNGFLFFAASQVDGVEALLYISDQLDQLLGECLQSGQLPYISVPLLSLPHLQKRCGEGEGVPCISYPSLDRLKLRGWNNSTELAMAPKKIFPRAFSPHRVSNMNPSLYQSCLLSDTAPEK